ncbi:universal stress protein [Echinicola jeungdonensis]|uniref:Universal stress protein n=1 Tax=Echinicola jeungdonensis TaxID=709343 RepID=A0ABV5J488_9BACT|nr:universal stress protein [Echinicola jeungdonensis]MDN3670053.1 universal stress protein [Echinicola jeungdonensis]
MNLLLVTDFSKHSKNAIRFAMDMGQAYNAKITLLFTYSSVYGFSVQVEAYEKLIEKKAKKWLKKIQKKGLKKGLTIGYKIRKGNIKNATQQITKKQSFELIILPGPITKKPWDYFWPGEKVELINSCSSPILVLPPNKSFLGLKTIEVVISKNNQNLPIWEQMIELTKGFRLPYRLLFLGNKVKAKSKTSPSKTLDFLKQHFPNQQFSWKVGKKSANKNDLLKLPEQKSKSLIVYFTKAKPTLFSFINLSIASKMAIRTKVPLLIMKN